MQPLVQSERPPFSWIKGVLHAFAAALALVVLTSIAGAGLSPQLSYQLGRATGRDLLWTIVFAFMASYGFQTRRKKLGWVMLSLTVVLIGAECVLISRTTRRLMDDNRPLTAAERTRPASDGRHSRFCQAALGVSLPDPGKGFTPSPALEKRLRSQETDPNFVAKWAWEKSETGEHILLQVNPGLGSERALRDFATGVKSSFAQIPNVKLGDEVLHWTGRRSEYDISATFENGVHAQIHCLARRREGDLPPLTACLQTFSGEGDSLRDVRNGLDVGGCGE